MRKIKEYLKNKGITSIVKLIMLTFFTCCVTIAFVGCENGNLNIDKDKLSSNRLDISYLSGEQGIKKDVSLNLDDINSLDKQVVIENRKYRRN